MKMIAELKKKKKILNMNYLIIVLMKMRLVMIFSQYGLACKYGMIFQMSIYNWT